MDNIPLFLDFSHIYKEQQEWIENIEHVMVECSDIRGTNGYCDDAAAGEIRKRIEQAGDSQNRSHRIAFIDNGNYHYVSKIRADMIADVLKAPFDMVVFDHHTDMQPPRFGGLMSCGSWIRDALTENKMLRDIVLIGPDCCSEMPGRVKIVSGNESDIDDIIMNEPVFISIDKDVLDKDECPTNWDQGTMSISVMEKIIEGLVRNGCCICGADVCGEPCADASVTDVEKSADVNIRLLAFLQRIIG